MYKILWHHDIDRLKGKYVLVYNGLSQAIKIWTWIRNHPTIIKQRVHPYFVFALRAIASSSSPPARPPPGKVNYFCACYSELFLWILFMFDGNPYPLSRTWNLPSTTWNVLYLPLCLSFLHHHHLNLLSYQKSLLSLYIYLKRLIPIWLAANSERLP